MYTIPSYLILLRFCSEFFWIYMIYSPIFFRVSPLVPIDYIPHSMHRVVCYFVLQWLWNQTFRYKVIAIDSSLPSAAYMCQWIGGIGSNNGLAPKKAPTIIWTSAGLLSIRPLGTNFHEILIKIQNFLFTKMHLKTSSAKWQPFCPGEMS